VVCGQNGAAVFDRLHSMAEDHQAILCAFGLM